MVIKPFKDSVDDRCFLWNSWLDQGRKGLQASTQGCHDFLSQKRKPPKSPTDREHFALRYTQTSLAIAADTAAVTRFSYRSIRCDGPDEIFNEFSPRKKPTSPDGYKAFVCFTGENL